MNTSPSCTPTSTTPLSSATSSSAVSNSQSPTQSAVASRLGDLRNTLSMPNLPTQLPPYNCGPGCPPSLGQRPPSYQAIPFLASYSRTPGGEERILEVSTVSSGTVELLGASPTTSSQATKHMTRIQVAMNFIKAERNAAKMNGVYSSITENDIGSLVDTLANLHNGWADESLTGSSRRVRIGHTEANRGRDALENDVHRASKKLKEIVSNDVNRGGCDRSSAGRDFREAINVLHGWRL
jgi:hypothetical protein